MDEVNQTSLFMVSAGIVSQEVAAHYEPKIQCSFSVAVAQQCRGGAVRRHEHHICLDAPDAAQPPDDHDRSNMPENEAKTYPVIFRSSIWTDAIG